MKQPLPKAVVMPPGSAGDDGASAVCPRCQRAFHCGAQDATPCDCRQVTLSPATQAMLQQRYPGCLCLACLRDIAAGQPVR